MESDDFNLDQIVDSAIEWPTNATPINSFHKEQPSTKQIPSSELKALPSHLKYKYLGEKEAFPVISLHLTTKQEEDLLAVLRENRLDHGRYQGDQPINYATPHSSDKRQNPNETHNVDSIPSCKRLYE